jgi:hypothetical protein
MRVGERFGVFELVTCEWGVRYLVVAGIGYLCLDLLAYLFDCVDPALRQPWRLRCQGSRRRSAQILLDSRGLAELEWHLGGFRGRRGG